MRKPRQLSSHPGLAPGTIDAATYVGSAEHKDCRWWGGLPATSVDRDGNRFRPNKQQTTICPLVSDAERHRATDWVREALRRGQYKFEDVPKGAYPRWIWYRDPETKQAWLGLCINVVGGTYKGWPVDDGEYDGIVNKLAR